MRKRIITDKAGILGMIESLALPDFEQNDVSRANRSLKISGRNVMAPKKYIYAYVCLCNIGNDRKSKFS
jgi:hypothetical protein